MKLLNWKVVLVFVFIVTLLLAGCANGVDNGNDDNEAAIGEDNNNLVGNDLVDDNDIKILVEEKLSEFGVTATNIDWEMTAEIMELSGIEWCYVQVDDDNKKVSAQIFFQPGLNGNESFEITDKVNNIIKERYQDYTVNIKGSM